MVESLGSWWRSLTHRNDDDEHDADDDTLDDATNALLSMLPLASIVVDEHDEVIRAHPSAYSLGVVRDDVIIEDSVLQAVREVRSFGGKKQFDLTPPPRMLRNIRRKQASFPLAKPRNRR